MKKTNSVFIATSLDGYIAEKDGGIDWLNSIPNPEGIDMGYTEFTSQIDALVMGRNSFETVCGFEDIEWPYDVPVFVLSNTMTAIPKAYKNKAFLVKGTLTEILEKIHKKGYHRLYIDGGKTIQSFLKENLIDDITITIIPILLGDGIPLFGKQKKHLNFRCVKTEIFLNSIVQNHYKRG